MGEFLIIYKLKCSNDHEFEGWFKSIDSFEEQKRKSLVVCPVCASKDVAKVPTTLVAVKSLKEAPPKSVNVNYQYALLKKISDRVKKEFEFVGSRFPEEARKIHYGEVEKKNIYGSTTQEEENKLEEEGIEFFKFPMMPDTND